MSLLALDYSSSDDSDHVSAPAPSIPQVNPLKATKKPVNVIKSSRPKKLSQTLERPEDLDLPELSGSNRPAKKLKVASAAAQPSGSIALWGVLPLPSQSTSRGVAKAALNSQETESESKLSDPFGLPSHLTSSSTSAASLSRPSMAISAAPDLSSLLESDSSPPPVPLPSGMIDLKESDRIKSQPAKKPGAKPDELPSAPVVSRGRQRGQLTALLKEAKSRKAEFEEQIAAGKANRKSGSSKYGF